MKTYSVLIYVMASWRHWDARFYHVSATSEQEARWEALALFIKEGGEPEAIERTLVRDTTPVKRPFKNATMVGLPAVSFQ